MDSLDSTSNQPSSSGEDTQAQLSSVAAAELERRRQQRKEETGAKATEQAPVSPKTSERNQALAARLQVTPSSDEQGDYIRLIRDGHADRVEAIIREVGRDIEVGRKTDRYSDTASGFADEFQKLAKEFMHKKELLARVEERIGGLRKLLSERADVNEIREALGQDQPAAEKVARLLAETADLRDELVDMAVRLFELRDELDEQVREDGKREDSLRATLAEYMDSFSAKERVNLELRLEQALRGKRVQDRLEILEKFERKLADSTPEGRERRKEELRAQGRACLEAGRYEEAIPLLEQAHSLMLTDEDVLLDLAKAYKGQNRLEDAVKVLKEVLKGGGSIAALLPLAECLEQLGRINEALSAYERAVVLRPNDLSIQVAQCRTLFRGGKAEEAIGRLTGLYARHPESSEVALILARLCVAGGLSAKAREILVKLTENSPQCIDAWEDLANLHWENGRLDDAEQAYRRLLEIDPENRQARIRLADLARQSGDFQMAEEHYRAVANVDGDSFALHLGLGIVLRETGREADALTELKRAVALKPQDGEALHHLGLTYLKMGDANQAARTMQKAVSFGFHTT